jgi:hypothetical protein
MPLPSWIKASLKVGLPCSLLAVAGSKLAGAISASAIVHVLQASAKTAAARGRQAGG